VISVKMRKLKAAAGGSVFLASARLSSNSSTTKRNDKNLYRGLAAVLSNYPLPSVTADFLPSSGGSV
jgi:hypothetical protein